MFLQQVQSQFQRVEIHKYLSTKMSESEIGSGKTEVSESECKVVVDTNRAVRNVQTQHGDYRTVDEENIVILPLARCHSPEPPVDESGEVEAVVWIEPFSEENQVNDLFVFRFVRRHSKTLLLVTNISEI